MRDGANWQMGEDLAFGLEAARTSMGEGGAQSEVRVSISRKWSLLTAGTQNSDCGPKTMGSK